MANMVRKQIYLEKGQDRLLKRLAEARGVSEAEVVRQAIEREALQRASLPADGEAEAVEALLAFARRRRKSRGNDQAYRWHREDAYAERGLPQKPA